MAHIAATMHDGRAGRAHAPTYKVMRLTDQYQRSALLLRYFTQVAKPTLPFTVFIENLPSVSALEAPSL